MFRPLIGVMGVAVLMLSTAFFAHSQKATEIFIPIGKSPGVSEKITIIGKIESIKTQQKTITVAGATETWTAEISSSTHIWVDRSGLGLSNQKGRFEDLREGLLVEIKYEKGDGERKGPAEWIKVKVEDAG